MMGRKKYFIIVAIVFVITLFCVMIGCEQTTECNHFSLNHHYPIKATCIKDGSIEYWTCNECGKYFADSECKSEITAEQTIVGAKGHSLDHVASLAPTCNTNGNMEYWQCLVCGKSYADEQALAEITVNDIEIAAKGHTFIDGFCTVCGIEEPTQGLAYQINSDGKSYYVSGIGTATDNNIIIADLFEGLPVTKVGSLAFYNTAITSVIIPDSINCIDSSAFRNCSNLTSIVIPDSVMRIGDNAFNKCVSLTSIVIPVSVRNIEDYTFYDCIGLTSIEIPYNVTSIGRYAFENCTNLTSIVIPDSVTNIGNKAFEGCDNIIKAIMPTVAISYIPLHNIQEVIINGGENIKDNAFENCGNLTSIKISNSVTRIGHIAFAGCTNLTSIVISDNVTIIGSYVFAGCSNLTSIVIPDSVTSIGDWALLGCNNLTSIIIPDGVISMGDDVFYGCSSLIIYCEVDSQPSSWNSDWNVSNCPVVWGYTG